MVRERETKDSKMDRRNAHQRGWGAGEGRRMNNFYPAEPDGDVGRVREGLEVVAPEALWAHKSP